MRIISGQYKGRKLSEKIPSQVRPTLDKARESIFNVLSNYIDFEERIVADICAGTGALGFESLSRGAGKVFFFEQNQKVAELIKENAGILQIEKNAYSIFPGKAETSLKQFSALNPTIKFDLVFCDPPYKLGIINAILSSLLTSEVLSDEAILCLEYNSALGFNKPEAFELLTKKKFGETEVSILSF